MERSSGLTARVYILLSLFFIFSFVLCVCSGSTYVSLADTAVAIKAALTGRPLPSGAGPVIIYMRLPRVICAALIGASLSLCGAAMQGLLRNPLADGGTLGVSSGASLGAVLSIAFGITVHGLPLAGAAVMAMIFAFFSLLLILAISYRIDFTLSSNTIILVGVIFSMFASSIISLAITFAGERVKSIMFWTMGMLTGSSYADILVLAPTLAAGSMVLLSHSRELNAFAMGEDNARCIGVNVRRVKLTVLICVSALIGVCVSVGGTIGFVGLVIPHMTRMITGPNHRRLLPASMFAGASFLMLSDLAARIILRPLELPIGVITSFIGSIAFVIIFYRSRTVK